MTIGRRRLIRNAALGAGAALLARQFSLAATAEEFCICARGGDDERIQPTSQEMANLTRFECRVFF